MDVVTRARSYLKATHRAPRMFATTREAMMCHITSVVYILIDDFNVIDFWRRHLGTRGSAYLGTQDPVTDDWARSVIDDALKLLPDEP